MIKPIVAIVGRPNVGKSTLFNRLTETRLAIVEDTPGVTRDRLYGECEWLNKEFLLVDTGGIEVGSQDIIRRQMRKQAEVAIEEADLIIFLVDGREGLTSADEEVAEILRRSNRPVLLVVNKIDNVEQANNIYEFYQLGLGDPNWISANHGINIGDLLDKVLDNLKDLPIEEYEEEVIKIAFIGRPNVGKSSLVNAILGEERVIVSDIPGTTRDAIDTLFTKDDKKYVLIDTAGMRKKSKIETSSIERYSVLRSLRAIDRADVCLMIIDATEGVTEQDKKIAGYAHEAGKAIVIVVNKWDLIEKDNATFNDFRKKIKVELPFMNYAETLFVSALTKQRVNRITEFIDRAYEAYTRKLSTSVINEVINEAISLHQPPSERGVRLKVYYVVQSAIKPPTFIVFVNKPEIMHFSFQRYIENQIRDSFDFSGTPIKFHIRKK